MFGKSRDFTKAPPPKRSAPPEKDDDGLDEWGDDDGDDSGGCLWFVCIALFVAGVVGSIVGIDWAFGLPGLAFALVGFGLVLGHVQAKSLKDLLTLPSAVLVCYGIVAFTAPMGADLVVPNSWQWPMPPERAALALPGGLRAATTDGVNRVQIYDAAGNYVTGWFVPARGGHMEILGPDPAMGESTLEVYATRAEHELILYNLEGRVLQEADAPEYFKATPRGRLVSMTFQAPWYLWPLVSPPRGWVLIVLGGLSLGAVQLLTSGELRKTLKKLRSRRLRKSGAGPIPAPQKPTDWTVVCFLVGFMLGVGLIAAGGLGLIRRPGIMVALLIAVIFCTGLVTYIVKARADSVSRRVARLAKFVPSPGRLSLDYRNLLFALLGMYGIIGFVIPPFAAPVLIPAEWEWPMPRHCSMLELPGGLRAGVQPSAHRVQFYDAAGNYVTGWYLDNSGTLLGSGPGEPSSMVVQVSDWVITFDLEGRELRREELPDYTPRPVTGRFTEAEFDTWFFLLPLTNPVICWVMAFIAMVGIGGKSRKRRALSS